MSLIGSLLTLCLLGVACASSADTGEVSVRSGDYGAKLATSTTLDAAQALLGSRTASSASSSGSQRAEVTQQLLDKIAANPELAAQLQNLTPEQLSQLTGLSVSELTSLGITPATVASLGQALVATRGLSGGGDLDANQAALAAIALASGTLSKETVAALREADPAALAALFGASVDPSITEPLGKWLKVLDPNGLGRFSEDQSMLAVLAVVMGAQLGRDPVPLDNLGKLPPDLQTVLTGIAGLADSITPQVVRELNRLTLILGPNVLNAIGASFGLLDQPAIADVVQKALNDDFTFASILASAMLLMPGLPEVLNPGQYNTSQERIAALGTIFLVALVRADPIGLRQFLDSIGVQLPPEFWQNVPPAPA